MKVWVPGRERHATVMYGMAQRATRVWVSYDDQTREPVLIDGLLSGAVVADRWRP